MAGPDCEPSSPASSSSRRPDGAIPRAGPSAGESSSAAYLTVPVYAAFHQWLGRGDIIALMALAAWAALLDRKGALEAIPDSARRRVGHPRRRRAAGIRVCGLPRGRVNTTAIAILPTPGINLLDTLPSARLTCRPSQALGQRVLVPAITIITGIGGCPAQICVIVRGQVVLDETFKCRPDDIVFPVLGEQARYRARGSAHARRARSLARPRRPGRTRLALAFGQHGKEGITIRHVLQHRSGLPVARGMRRDVLATTRLECVSSGLSSRPGPAYPPGQVPAYHVLSYGIILCEPHTAGDRHQRPGLCLRRDLRTRSACATPSRPAARALAAARPLRGRGAVELATQLVIVRREIRQAVIPAASVSATARDLARLYQALPNGGEPGGARVLSAETIRQATTLSSDGETDRYLNLPIRWSGRLPARRRAQGQRLLTGGGPGPMGRSRGRRTRRSATTAATSASAGSTWSGRSPSGT